MKQLGASIVLIVSCIIGACTASTLTPTSMDSEATIIGPTRDLKAQADSPTEPTNSQNNTSTPENGVVVIQGVFDPAGENLLELKPVRRYSYRSEPIPNQATGRFLVIVTYVSGDVTTLPFDALIADDAGNTRHGFFEVVIPLQGEIASIQITDADRQTIFAHIDGSDILP